MAMSIQRPLLSRLLPILVTLLAVASSSRSAAAQGTPIGFEETFALATDRSKVLEQLIPGTREYYYYSCLERQGAGDRAQVGELLKIWIERYGRDQNVRMIENREALLEFERNPTASYASLVERLGLRFSHQRQTPDSARDLPSSLDPSLLSRSTLLERALSRHRGTLDGLRDSALESLVGARLDENQLMSLLGRLQRPDVANLPALVVRNLEHPRSRGFGSLPIHQRLLLEQLDACAGLRPALLQEPQFVQAYLTRLRPSEDVDWSQDEDAREAYLERLEAFVQRLTPANDSLEAHVLHHRLVHDLQLGQASQARLLAYLKLPRQAPWVSPQHARASRAGAGPIDPNADYPTGLGRIGDEQALIRTYLLHFFRSESDWRAFSDYLHPDYLRRLFAEAKILAGEPDMERWYSMLDDPGYYEQLKERVDIDFAATQRTHFERDEPVSIDVDLKNVGTLIVKLFEINSFNYLRDQSREVDASIDLDGLVANEESTYEISDNPLLRVRRHFELPSASAAGVFVVELIGNGLSSRAVIQKGRLQLQQRYGAAGHVLRVLDERGELLKDATIWTAGREWTADESGDIAIPFTTDAGTKRAILRHGRQATLASFEHQDERYRLSAGFLLDREALLPGRKARILVRPHLSLHGVPISLDVLEDARLEVTSVDRDGLPVTLSVPDFQLAADAETVQEIQVPEGLASLQVSLHGRVRNLSAAEDQELGSEAHRFELNAIDAGLQTACPLLGRDADGYVLDVLGKNGEPRADEALELRLVLRDFSDDLSVTLETDQNGRIRLGALAGVTEVRASGLPSNVGGWHLSPEELSYPGRVQGVVGQTLRIAYQGAATSATREALSLIEVRSGVYVRDAFEALSLAGGYVELAGLAAGDYSLRLKEAQRDIFVRVTAGEVRAGWGMGASRRLELSGSGPLQVSELALEGEQLVLRLNGGGPEARVHILCTRYLPAYDPYANLYTQGDLEPRGVDFEPSQSSYHSGREIGAEYRYILERRYASKYPGNMLHRPGLLLNPWALDETVSGVGMGGGAGGRFGGRRNSKASGGATPGKSERGTFANIPGTFPNLDFLPEPSALLIGLHPGVDGRIRVPLAELGSGSLIQVLAVDAESTVYTSLAREGRPLVARDQRLTHALAPERHLAQQRRIEFLDAGAEARVEDAVNSRIKLYDSLSSVFELYRSLSGDPELLNFAFVLEWPKLAPERKLELYSQYACHELHLFLHEKDPAFFDTVVRPYLENKAHKKFLDHWLLDDDLSSFLEPWAFQQLNIAEQLLLAKRLQGQGASGERRARELFELLTPDPEERARLFRLALQSQSLEESSGAEAAFDETRKAVKERALSAETRRAGPASPGPQTLAAPAEEPALRDRAFADGEQDLEEAETAKGIVRPEGVETGSDDFFLGQVENKQGQQDKDLGLRVRAQLLYRGPAATRAFAESDYWHLRIEQTDADLISINAFWMDYAACPADAAFVSPNFASASGSFAEMMFALALLDLPFEAGEHALASGEDSLSLTSASPLLLVREELQEVALSESPLPVLVSQNFFRYDDRYRFEENQRYDKYVREFLVGVPYGAQVVLTNPTSSPRKLELLMQIPAGAIRVNSGFTTRGISLQVAPYATQTFEYGFYFPEVGRFTHFPVHVSSAGALIASADARTLEVLPEPSEVDTTSWQYVSQNGTPEEVITYLERTNLQRTALAQIAWRMRQPAFFDQVTNLLRARHTYEHTLWSYALWHRRPQPTREFLRNAADFVAQCGRALSSPLLEIDPIERKSYQHLEYSPLFNPRAHRFGRKPEILDHGIAAQYRALLDVLAFRPQLDDEDWMSVSYYLLLQDRVEQALASFARVDPTRLETRIQYDYMQAYMDFFSRDHALARAIAEPYRDYPVERWRRLFRDVLSQLDEADGLAGSAEDPDDRTRTQGALANQEPSLSAKVESRRVTLSYENLERCELSYYEMDIEFLFSTSPFVQQGSGSFAYIRPNRTDLIELPATGHELSFELPAEFKSSNVLVEARAGGIVQREAYYANSLDVRAMANFGQLQVRDAETRQPLSAVYVKVFARDAGGQVRFHKDGYTDLRGRFDYASLSGPEGGAAERYSILVLSESEGATILEVAAPAK